MFKKIRPHSKLPESQTEYSAGFDICSEFKTRIGAGKTMLVPTGVRLSFTEIMKLLDVRGETEEGEIKKEREFMSSHYFALHIRSSLAKRGLSIPNGEGIIDMDYRDEIMLMVHNRTEDDMFIEAGERVGQLILKRHEGNLLSAFRRGERRTGGFGSTDTTDGNHQRRRENDRR